MSIDLTWAERIAAVVLLAGMLSGGAAISAEPVSAKAVSAAVVAERVTPSGLPVPRYVTLKFAKVNARAGPGDDHRLLWVYRARDLPVQVVAETAEWRQVCDPRGSLAWVHKRTVDGHRAVLNAAAKPAPLFRNPKTGSQVVAFLNTNAVASLVRCRKGWCRVKADGASGWVKEGALWGTSEAPQCR